MRAFIGIDVQEKPGCCFAVIGDDKNILESGWFGSPEEEASRLVEKFKKKYDVWLGIDAPRTPLVSPRKWYWDGARSRWRLRRPTEKGYGRHCEIVVRVHGIANPQFTPLMGEAAPWMVTGFKLFMALQGLISTSEVFPTASYALLQGLTDVQVCMDFSHCKPGPKDMLDAYVAAVTIREFADGQGCEVGGGDGLGTIVLPRPLRAPVIKEVLSWPQDQQK